MNELALFAGAGGGILGGKLLGWRTVCAVERDAYCAAVLAQRQNDGCLEPFPIWSDVETFDGRPWRGIVDVVSGGFPCQDISCAGKGSGIDGAKSGLWREMARIIGEVRPRFVFVENSPLLVGRGLTRVLGDLASMGYDARWGIVGADDCGAPHRRKRIWIVANTESIGCQTTNGCSTEISGPELGGQKMCNTNGPRLEIDQPRQDSDQQPTVERTGWWDIDPADEPGAVESGMGRVAHGISARLDKLKALGNAQVPIVAATAWRTLTQD
jgi:DNA (cytosine-5)-methyltransferase 1